MFHRILSLRALPLLILTAAAALAQEPPVGPLEGAPEPPSPLSYQPAEMPMPEARPDTSITAWRLVLVPKSLRTPLARPLLEGGWVYVAPARLLTEETAISALEAAGDLQLLRTEDDALAATAQREGQAFLKDLLVRHPVDYVRDSAGLVRYASLTGVEPSVATLFTLPEFYQRYEPVFGPGFRVVAPNQFTLYLFPAENDDALRQMARSLSDAYRESAYPVSREIYGLSAEGVQVLGELPR